MKRTGCLTAAASAVVLLVLLGWGAVAALDSLGRPDNHVAATDSRVCPQTGGNNLSLADATRHFGLVVPSAATDLVFTADAGGMQGENNLKLRFTTTPAGLAAFLAASHLAPPSATTRAFGRTPGMPAEPADGPCGLTPPVSPGMTYSQDSADHPTPAGPRSVAVDGVTDPAHPVVWVSGADL